MRYAKMKYKYRIRENSLAEYVLGMLVAISTVGILTICAMLV
jgi:hypothetical protein